ncbi:MAG: hypothetical protein E7227_02735 [Clostridiales bacterium]|nr:hypothetical protein [Clostridiales bacterium]
MTNYIIGSFNIERLNDDKDHKKIAEIIKEEQFDIVAIQEAKSRSAINKIVQHLNPTYWACSYPAGNEEYAFIWKKRRLKLWVFEDGKQNPYIDKKYDLIEGKGERPLIRPPYVGYFTTIGTVGGCRLDIRLINTHIIHDKPAIGYGDTQKYDVRRNELNILSREIYANVSKNVLGSLRSILTVLLGDFNLVICGGGPKYYNEVDLSRYDYRTKDGDKMEFIQDQETTLKRPKGDKNITEDHMDQEEVKEGDVSYYSRNYDHFGYDETIKTKYTLKPSRVDALYKYYNNDLAEYRKNISDHVPIKLKITLI